MLASYLYTPIRIPLFEVAAHVPSCSPAVSHPGRVDGPRPDRAHAGPARTQQLSDGLAPLDNKYQALRRSGLIKNLTQGNDRFDQDNARHKEAVEVAAKYPIYQLYLRHVDRQPGELFKLYQTFDRDVDNLRFNKSTTEGIIPYYSHQAMLAALEVLRKKETQESPVIRLNAARVLARLADLNQGELADALVDVLKDPTQTDAVRYYVLQGLRNLLSRQPQSSDMPPVVSKEQQDKVAQAVLEFLARPPSHLHAHSTPEEINGYRVLRRECCGRWPRRTNPP